MDATRPYILIVDDVADAADSLAELLTLWGYEAEPLDGGAAALDAARVRRPAAVLLDLEMPRMSGLQFAVRFRGVPGCEATPVLALTGHHTLALQAREAGIDHYLLKTCDFGVLKDLLGRLTARTEPSPPRATTRPPQALLPCERFVSV